MHIAITIVVLVTCVIAGTALSRRIGLSAPLVLVVAGFVGSYVPFIPDVSLTPDLVLIGLLPPLLYAAAIRTSLIDFRRNKRPIGLLSVGLVVFTTLGVGLVAWWILPIPLAAAFALGAVVAPPDAVAATSIARRVGMPRRIVTILEGESLVNDATALVTLRTAIAALTAGGVTVWSVGIDFVVSAVGAVAFGVVVAVVVGYVRRRVTDDLTDVSISLLTPWLAYIPAEEIHASGVLAVVVAGLLLGHKSPVIQEAGSRVFERTNWATIGFLLENTVFLLIGLQVRSVLVDLGDGDLAISTVIWATVIVLATTVGLRFIWVFATTYLPRVVPAVRRSDPAPPWQYTTTVAWAGMRGVVTLAAVFLLPSDTPHREAFVAIAFGVTAGTLLLQGLTLPWVVRRLDLHGPDPHEDHLQEATVYQRAARAGIERLDDELVGDEPHEVVERLRRRSLDRANAVWERLGGTVDPPSVQYARLRHVMLEAEREEVLRIRRKGHIDQVVLRNVLDALDVEETVLDRSAGDYSTADREVDLVPSGDRGRCVDLRTYVDAPRPRTPDGCERCLQDGTIWVHLRLCMTCGYVGCCDSSPGRHASGHWHESEHPVMRSFEPGEAWRWCFSHQLPG